MNDFEKLVQDSYDLTKYAIYPDVGNNLAYPVLGFVDEMFGEYLSEAYNGYTPTDRMYDELIDVYWYLNQITFELSKLYGIAFERLFDWDGFRPDFDTEFLVAVGQLAGIAKKIMRDGVSSAEKKRDIALSAYNMIRNYVHSETYDLDKTTRDVVNDLHKKLGSRQERGVLNGDGDYR